MTTTKPTIMIEIENEALSKVVKNDCALLIKTSKPTQRRRTVSDKRRRGGELSALLVERID